MYWYNWLSWWWTLGCSKHVEKWNKHIKKSSSRWLLTRIVPRCMVNKIQNFSSSCSPSLFSRTAVGSSFEGTLFGNMCPFNSGRSRVSQVRTTRNGHHVGGNCSLVFTGRNVAVRPPQQRPLLFQWFSSPFTFTKLTSMNAADKVRCVLWGQKG